MKSDIFVNFRKEQLNIWATFERKFVANKFQKSPNLATLDREVELLRSVECR